MKEIKWLIKLFKYNHWANIRLLTELEKNRAVCYQALPISFGKIYGLLWHMYYYDLKVYQRIVENNHHFLGNEKLSLEDLLLAIKHLSEQWLAWISTSEIGDISENSGTKYLDETIINDWLTVYSHNIHHRGQIVNTLSMLALSPASLDIYLYYSQLNEDRDNPSNNN